MKRKEIDFAELTIEQFKALLDYHTNLCEEEKQKCCILKNVLDYNKFRDKYYIRN